jgi:hydroxymethylpyrimidine pyrophosphatase-like HAD family hydrolase
LKFGVLALDYDGTIAQDGALNAEVRAAIAEARARRIVVVLVTGRTLSDLRQCLGDLGLVDAVVGENGAVVWFPTGNCRQIGHAPPEGFTAELNRRGVVFTTGQCVVECDASFAPQLLSVIRDLELPLVLSFNRSRLMVLPQGISKSVGLREALSMLRLSAHNAIAIGDAENDHDLLATCEVGVAVGWGSKALQAVADLVLPGEGPAAVAPFILRVTKELRLPHENLEKHRLSLGTEGDQHILTLPVQGRNVVVAGDPQSGKSWVAGLCCEQLILQGYSVCVIDPEGDYRTLEALPGVVVLGAEAGLPELPDLARLLRHPDMSVVVDLSHVSYKEKVNYLYMVLPMIASIRRTTGLPHRVVIDEAHYFLHETNVKKLLDLYLGAYTLVTYRLSDLHPDVCKAVEAVIVKRTTDPREVRALLSWMGDRGTESAMISLLAQLELNEAVLVSEIERAEGKSHRFRLFPRLTSHVHHKEKYLDVQVPTWEGFVFTEDGRALGSPVRTMNELISSLEKAPDGSLNGHLQRGDLSKWISNVFHDHMLASDLRKIERHSRPGDVREVRKSVTKLIRERYEDSSQCLCVT